jgi:hypothetical protein
MSELTVPRAPTTVGRVAEVRVEAPQTGAVLAEFGQQMFRVGDALEGERLDRAMGRARIEAMEGLNGLRLEMEEIGDPDRIDAEYAPRTKALRDGWLANVDPKIRADAELMFDEMSVAHQMSLGRQSLDLRQSQRRAALMQTRQVALNTASQGDPDVADAAFAAYRDTLDQAVANGSMTPEQAEADWQAFGSENEQGRMTGLLSRAPGALLQAIDSGELGQNLTPAQRESYRARAQSELARGRAEGVAQARDRLKDGIAVLRTGSPFAGAGEVQALLQDPVIAALPEAREYRDTLALNEAQPGFAQLPLADKRARRKAAAAAPKDKAYEANVVEAMDRLITAHEAAIKDDSLGWIEQAGLKPVEPLPDPTAGFDDLTAGLRQRLYAREGAKATGIVGDKPHWFRPDERDAYARLAAPDASPADNLKLATALATLGPDGAEQAAAELGAPPMFAHLGGGVAVGAIRPEVARQAFEGARVIARNDVALPPVSERRHSYFQAFRTLFSDGSGETGLDETEVREAVIATADAIYAYRKRENRRPGDKDFDGDAYARILHEVLGGQGSPDSGTGGVGVIRNLSGDYAIQLPRGVAAADVQGAVDRLIGTWKPTSMTQDVIDADAGRTRVYGMKPEDWRKVTVGGKVPMPGGDTMDLSTWERTVLRAVGDNRYRLDYPLTGGGFKSLVGEDGKPVLIDLRKLLAFGADE